LGGGSHAAPFPSSWPSPIKPKNIDKQEIEMKTTLSALATVLALSSPAFAEDTANTDAETAGRDIIVTGIKSEPFGEKSSIPLDRVPQSVQILTAEDITERGVTSIGDLLRTVPSANIGNSRVSRYQSFSLKVRGFLVDQMRNGIRQRYYEDVDASALSNVERVELLKGPSGVLYGQSAIGGIASIITKSPQDSFAGSVAATVGRFDQKVVTLDVGGPLSDTLGIRVTGEIERSGSFVPVQDIDRDNYAVNLRWQPTKGVDAHLVLEYIERRTLSNPGLPVIGTVVSNGVAPISRQAFLAEPAFAGLKASSPLIQAWVNTDIGHGWAITPRFQYSELVTPFTQIRVLGVDSANPLLATRNGRIGSEKDNYTIGQLDLTGTVKTGGIEHKLLLGYEYDRERSVFIQSNFASVPSINVLNPIYLTQAQRPPQVFAFNFKQRLDGHALYAQDQVAIGERLGLVLGIRHSWITNNGFFSSDPTTFGSPDVEKVELTSFQAGATYKLNGGFSLFGGYNSGFDVENSFGGAPTIGGGRLQPETSEQFEAGLRYATDKASFSISSFEIRRRDVAGDDLNNPGFTRNIGSFRVRGIELEGQFEPAPGLRISGGFAYLDSAITASATLTEIGGRIADVAKQSGNIRASYAIPGTPLDIRGGLIYQGKRPVAGASPILLDDVLLADLGIGADLGRFRIDITANNLFDKRYFTVDTAHQGNSNAVQAGEPLSVSARVAIKF
jgi:iron complex outermembrane recepter protein